MELTINSFSELQYEECLSINGGVNWGDIVEGCVEIIIGAFVCASGPAGVVPGVCGIVI